MFRRSFTLSEWTRLVLLSAEIRDTRDKELGEALLRVAQGDDGAMTTVHDRLQVVGDFTGADRVRRMVAK